MKRFTVRAVNSNSIVFPELELEKKFFLNSDLQISPELELELGQKSIEFAALISNRLK